MSVPLITSPFIQNQPPTWASAWGQDQHGYYADWMIESSDDYWDVLTQRMRWIPPGSFKMGGDVNYNGNTIENGFWFADTTCTQELWQAVMGDNPSRFDDRDDCPVEQVSFEDVSRFLDHVNEMIPKLNLALPNEEQWEYACRAGTTTPFSFGGTITTDQANFDGNYPMGDSPKGEYRQRTVGVKELPCNLWGLYQMHGNVWEWITSAGSSLRVVRGGGWLDGARFVRSADRVWLHPGTRFSHLGFRCLSSAEPSQPGRRAE